MIRFDIELINIDGSSELIYTALDWEHPPILQLNEPLVLTSGMSLNLKCSFNNTTDEYIQYGLLSTNEMMILFGYFYTD